MKFGPVPPRDAEGATAVHTIRQGALVLKKGTVIGAAEVAALEAAGITDVVVARLEPGDVSEDEAAAEIAEAVAGDGRRSRPRLHRPLQPVCGKRRACWWSTARHRRDQPHRRGDHVRDAAGLQAGGRRRDDRDGEDHSVRGQRDGALIGAGGREPNRSCGSRPTRSGRSAWSRRCCRGSPPKVIDKTLAGDRGAAGAGRRAHRRRAARAARAGGARQGDRRGSEATAPNWSSCSALPPSPTGAT